MKGSKTSLKTLIGAALAATLLQAPAAADEELPVGVATSKNLVERTVRIDDQLFRVTDATKIVGRNGQPLAFEQVETAADHGSAVPLDRITYAYDAHGDVLALLKSAPVPR